MWLFHKLKRPYQHRNKAGATSALRRSSVLGDFFSTLNSVIMNHKISYFLRKEKKTIPTWALNCFPVLHGELKALNTGRDDTVALSEHEAAHTLARDSSPPRARAAGAPRRRLGGADVFLLPRCSAAHRFGGFSGNKPSHFTRLAEGRAAAAGGPCPCWTGGDAETPRQC